MLEFLETRILLAGDDGQADELTVTEMSPEELEWRMDLYRPFVGGMFSTSNTMLIYLLVGAVENRAAMGFMASGYNFPAIGLMLHSIGITWSTSVENANGNLLLDDVSHHEDEGSMLTGPRALMLASSLFLLANNALEDLIRADPYQSFVKKLLTGLSFCGGIFELNVIQSYLNMRDQVLASDNPHNQEALTRVLAEIGEVGK